MLSPHVSAPHAVAALCCVMAVSAPTSRAAEQGKRTFNLPRGDAAVTLKQFATAAGTPIVYLVDRVRGATTNAVSGQFTPREALDRMLDGSGLEAAQDAKTGALVVSRKRGASKPTRNEEVGPVSDPQPEPKSHAMNSPRTLFAVLAGWIAAVTAVDAQTTTSPAKDEALQLPQFTVSSSKGDTYRATDALSLARISGEIIDTPVSINVLSRELLDDLGANSTFEAARYFAGIGNGRGAGTAGGINDRMNFRGFESQTRTVDNFSSTFIPSAATSIDTFEPEFIERVEIVLGPDAILNPTGTPGGSMNVVTKSPLFKRQTMLKAVVGNFNAQKFAFDTTGALPIGDGKHWAYRIMGSGQDTKTYIPGKFQKWDVGIEFLYQISPTSRVMFKYFGLDFKAYGNASAPNDNGWLVYEPTSIGGATLADTPRTPGVTYNGINGVDTNSITVERTNQLQLLYTGTIANFISMRLGAQLLSHNNVGDSAFPSSATTSSSFDPVTGQVNSAPAFNPAAVPVVWRYNKGIGVMHQFQNDYAANFHPGPLSLQAVTGWAYQHNHDFPTRTGTAPMPSVNLFTGAGQDAPRPDIHTFSFGNRSKNEATQKSAYALLKSGFINDRVFITGGVTRVWLDVQRYTLDPITNVSVVGSPARLGDSKDSFIGSALVKPMKNVSVYYTYSTNALSASFSPGNGAPSIPIWSVGRQHEIGLKSEWLDQRLSFSAAHFQMAQTNVQSNNPLANINPQVAPTILTDNSNRGYEFNLVGGVTRNLSTIVSYTSMEFRDAFKRRQRNVPDKMAGALANYHFTAGPLNNLSVFGAVSYFGQSAGETQTGFTPTGAPRLPGFYVAAWHVFNAGLTYLHEGVTYGINVDNVLNSKFGWQPASRLTVSPYPGTAVRLTTTLKF